MALIHSKLYQSENLTSIEFGGYINELIDSISNNYNLINTIKSTIKYSDANFNIDLSINLGLIINELISNSYKHAFQNKKNGCIHIELINLKKNSYQLIIRDNGNGLPEQVDIQDPKTFGLEIVVALTKQIEGTIKAESDQGLKYTLTFNK